MMRTEDSDLGIALDFIIGRIAEEAARLGEPLNEDEQFLLANLPRTSVLSVGTDADNPFANPRDLAFEKLCTLAKAARSHDLSFGPDESNWEFATAVLRLHGHPMLWLLQWAGIKERQPWWDRWLLFLAAIFTVGIGVIGMAIAENGNLLKSAVWDAILCVCVTLILLLSFFSQRLERWRLRRVIERCRPSFAA
jgi:hypothetical protein